ncbi:hypothetical protein [Haloarcula nitratireducens]|uniref:DUF7968 domain-containing protein n=1 Tax=Haloarcula nitratireducens TaxID=2487749 RepID=A0AAW4PH91_9EURY|nr:hypothetical protein [Halomicroarcula nitratireducens]MBX0297301.1 hypothetical protein [Halomicroarcula nitratireducens]
MADAERVRLRYAPDDDDVASALRSETFELYLRRSKAGPVESGDEWEEIVNDGCGRTRPVTLRVESVAGGSTVGEETRFEFRATTAE